MKSQRRAIYFSRETADMLDEYVKKMFGKHRATSMVVDTAVKDYLKDKSNHFTN